MKNFIKKLCPLFLGAVMLAGSTQSVPASEDNTEDPAEIYIGCDEYEPYNYLDENGNLAGIDADLAEDILLQTEIPPAISPRNVYSFQLMEECLAALRQGYVDAVAGDLFYLQTYMENYPNSE